MEDGWIGLRSVSASISSVDSVLDERGRVCTRTAMPGVSSGAEHMTKATTAQGLV